MIIFFSVVLAIYGAVNYYIFIRGLQAMPRSSTFRNIYIILFSLISVSYLAGRLLNHYSITHLSEFLIRAGSYWMAFILYFFMAVLLLDLIRLANNAFPFFPGIIIRNYDSVKSVLFVAVSVAVSAVVIAGHYNATHPKIKKMNIKIDKQAGSLRTLRIAAASDIHLGTLIRNSQIDMLVDSINAMKPDIVLFAGDIVDEELAPVVNLNLGEAFTRIQSKYGVYAVTGNHAVFYLNLISFGN